MTSRERIDSIIAENKGYLIVSNAIASGVSKSSLAEYQKRYKLEKAAQGVYITNDTWLDPLYVIQIRNKEVVFSNETALYLHGLMERVPFETTVTVKRTYNANHLRKAGCRICTVSDALFEMGVTETETDFGNKVRVYDIDRTICDIIKQKDKMDIQTFSYAIKEYFRGKRKNIPNLMKYARALKVEKIVTIYAEVLL